MVVNLVCGGGDMLMDVMKMIVVGIVMWRVVVGMGGVGDGKEVGGIGGKRII